MTQEAKDAALEALDTQISELQAQRAALEAEPVDIIIPPFMPSMPVPVGVCVDGVISISDYGDATSFQVQLHRPAPHAAVIYTVSPVIGGCVVSEHAPDAESFQVQGKFWSPDGVPDAESEWSEAISLL